MSKKQGFDGERTVMDVRKAEEREISDELHKNFQFINTIYPPSFDFQQCYAQDMFLKPNTKAFPHVMHYLFNILDPNEFRKRFYWPIDKSSEKAFRTNTVQYLNHLNDKHNLGWGEVKAFLVVMPGGIKFMKLLLRLIDFIMDEDIKRTEKSLLENFDRNKLVFTKENVEQLIANHELFVKKAVAYKEKLDKMKSMYNEKSRMLKEKLYSICESIGVKPEQINEDLFKRFASSNYDLFKSTISKKVNEIEETGKHLNNLSNQLDKFYNDKHKFPCDKNSLISSYKTIQSDHPEGCPDVLMTSDNKIKLSSLLNAFNCIFPSLEMVMGQCDLTKKRIENYEFEVNEISRLEAETMQLEGDIFKVENLIEDIKVEVDDLTKSTVSDDSNDTPTRFGTSLNNLRMKFIQTPAIYLNDEPSMSTTRLALLEDSSNKSFSFANQTTIIAGKSTGKNSEAMNLLRTLTKSGRKKKQASNIGNYSMLASKFKENEELFEKEEDNLSTTVIRSGACSVTPVSHKKRIIYAKELTTNARRQAIREKLVDNTDIILSPNGVIIEKKPPIEPVRSLDLTTICKSPSGRLEPLVKIDLPKILVEDSFMNSSDTLECTEFQDVTIKESNPAKQARDLQGDAKENELAVLCSNFQKKLEFNMNEESIFNVSDSILKEVND